MTILRDLEFLRYVFITGAAGVQLIQGGAVPTALHTGLPGLCSGHCGWEGVMSTWAQV